MSSILTRSLIQGMLARKKVVKAPLTKIFKLPSDYSLTTFIKQNEIPKGFENVNKYFQIGDCKEKIFFNPVKNWIYFK